MKLNEKQKTISTKITTTTTTIKNKQITILNRRKTENNLNKEKEKKEKEEKEKKEQQQEEEEKEKLNNDIKNDIKGPDEWFLWCSDNHMLSKYQIELTHYEIEACRRHFTHLKFHPSDEGVHPKTLADSFYRSEVFPTFNEALLFCQQLRNETNNDLLVFSDLLNAMCCDSIYKRNKVKIYMKIISTSELYQGIKSIDSEEKVISKQISSQLNISSVENILSSQDASSILAQTNVILTRNNSNINSPRSNLNDQNNVSKSNLDYIQNLMKECDNHMIQEHSPQHNHFHHHNHNNHNNHNNDKNDDNQIHHQHSHQQSLLPTSSNSPSSSSRNVLSNTLQSSRIVINNLVSNATGLLNGIFTTTTTSSGVQLSLVPKQRKTEYQRQESGETFRNYNIFKGGYSRSSGKSQNDSNISFSIPPSLPQNSIKEEEESTMELQRLKNECQMDTQSNTSPTVRIAPTPTSKSFSIKSSPKSTLPPKTEIDNEKIRPAVRFKSAAIKIYAANRFLHSNRVATNDKDDNKVTNHKLPNNNDISSSSSSNTDIQKELNQNFINSVYPQNTESISSIPIIDVSKQLPQSIKENLVNQDLIVSSKKI